MVTHLLHGRMRSQCVLALKHEAQAWVDLTGTTSELTTIALYTSTSEERTGAEEILLVWVDTKEEQLCTGAWIWC